VHEFTAVFLDSHQLGKDFAHRLQAPLVLLVPLVELLAVHCANGKPEQSWVHNCKCWNLGGILPLSVGHFFTGRLKYIFAPLRKVGEVVDVDLPRKDVVQELHVFANQ